MEKTHYKLPLVETSLLDRGMWKHIEKYLNIPRPVYSYAFCVVSTLFGVQITHYESL